MTEEFYFFRLDLLGGEPVWQVPQGLPFAIAGVACALETVRELIATVRIRAMAPMAELTSAGLIIFVDRMSPSNDWAEISFRRVLCIEVGQSTSK